jgi:glycosyltransferase involved in cell wall biosynthesis
VTAHAFDIFLPNPHRATNLRAASQVVTISEFNRRYLAGHGVDREITVIPCGLDLAQFVPSTAAAERSGIVAVGRLDPIKGFTVLIDACSLLAQRGVDFRCDIIGEGPERPILAARIAEKGLAGRVHLLGAREQKEVRSRVAHARVFALPCMTLANGAQDGIPVALMEAMALCIPVVTTPVSGIPELVTDGVSGLLARPQDPVSLADALVRVLTVDTLAQTIGGEGRRIVEHRHDVEATSMMLARLAGWQGDGLDRGTASPAAAASIPPKGRI